MIRSILPRKAICRHCKKEISVNAKKCPYCGHPVLFDPTQLVKRL